VSASKATRNHTSAAPQDYGIAVAVTAGCSLFPLTGSVASKVASRQTHSSGYGVALMLSYLGFDGFTSTWQDKLFKGYSMTIYNQTLYVTLVSAGLSFVGERQQVAFAVL
jgi:solute carrier family 35 (adenosine 3'-phospho 5'-phosphosulfate transporter), member B2